MERVDVLGTGEAGACKPSCQSCGSSAKARAETSSSGAHKRSRGAPRPAPASALCLRPENLPCRSPRRTLVPARMPASIPSRHLRYRPPERRSQSQHCDFMPHKPRPPAKAAAARIPALADEALAPHVCFWQEGFIHRSPHGRSRPHRRSVLHPNRHGPRAGRARSSPRRSPAWMTASCSSNGASRRAWRSTTGASRAPPSTSARASACARSSANRRAMPMPRSCPRRRSSRAGGDGARGAWRPERRRGGAAAGHQPRALHRRQSAGAVDFAGQDQAPDRDRRLCPRPATRASAR